MIQSKQNVVVDFLVAQQTNSKQNKNSATPKIKKITNWIKNHRGEAKSAQIEDDKLVISKYKDPPVIMHLSDVKLTLATSSKAKPNKVVVRGQGKTKFIVPFDTFDQGMFHFSSSLTKEASKFVEVFVKASKKPTKDLFADLPIEILTLAAIELDKTDLKSLLCVCKRIHSIGKHEYFWKLYFTRRTSAEHIKSIEMLKRGSSLVQISWKWLCQCLRVVPKASNFSGIGMSFDSSYHYWGWFKNGKFEGLGIQLSKNGSLYMGQWLNDEAQGIGVHISVGPRDRYEGYFKLGNFNGTGHYTWNGGEYRGSFKNGSFDGEGVCVYDDGTRYEGQFKEGKRWGHGKMFFQSGDRYEGQFNEGKRHGRGTYFFKNGDIHDGYYSNGKRHGVYEFSQNGKSTERFEVEFCNGLPVQGSIRQLVDVPADETPDVANPICTSFSF